MLKRKKISKKLNYENIKYLFEKQDINPDDIATPQSWRDYDEHSITGAGIRRGSRNDDEGIFDDYEEEAEEEEEIAPQRRLFADMDIADADMVQIQQEMAGFLWNGDSAEVE